MSDEDRLDCDKCKENGVITKQFEDCEKCPEFPCHELARALQAIINGEN